MAHGRDSRAVGRKRGRRLLAMREERCWQAMGSSADPTYTVIPCSDQGVLVAGGPVFASGSDSGALTTGW